MSARLPRSRSSPPAEYEFVDAESPEWSPAGEACWTPASRPAAEADPEAPEKLRAQARQRLRKRRAGRRQETATHLPAPWRQRLLEEIPFCVIDFETTGGSRDEDDEILEIGAVLVSQGELGREFATLVDPRRPITRAAQAVHGIGMSALQGAPILEHALPWLLEMTRDRVLVFHNARFDLPFLQRALRETQHELLQQPVLDTVVLARRVVGPPCALGVLGERLGLPLGRLHRALDDARLTARLLLELLELLRQAGWRTLEEVPGVCTAPSHLRSRRRSRVDPLAQRLETAARHRERLRITYHAGAGLAPLDLLVLPLRLVGGLGLVAEDCNSGSTVQLELGRIGPVRGAG